VAEPKPAPAAAARPPSGADALAQLVDVQREILSLPDDAAWLSGRIKAAAACLAGCLRASGRADELATLNQVAGQALAQASALPLAQWLEHAFAPLAGGPGPAPTPAAPVGQVAAPAAASDAAEAAPAQARPAEAAPAPAGAEPADGEPRVGRRAEDSPSARSLKVDQAKIDRLMNLIGEMVVAKNAIPYLASRAETVFGVRELSREIKAQYAVINRISEEMQDAIMQVRMMPVSFVFQRFPRLVRDTSRRLGKEVNLVLEGEDTAADKNIIEALGDPLVHIVRNSLDHGLELPEVRRAAGTPPVGTLRISARQESDRVIIEIRDDGKGIDPAVIKRKAYEKGLIDEAQLDRISDAEAVNLVFAPGFSTVEVISDLSGRGVGMDVVRTAVERINGSVALDSVVGQGTCLRLALPLSMAITNVMTIESDGQAFGVPMDVVVETVRVPRSAMRQIKQHLTTVLRGRVVPLKSLNGLLGLAAPPLANPNDELAVLVVRVGDDILGLLVDDFHATTDIILKPLAGVLGSLRAYAGSALMGDGSVLMVLNVKEML
jgi:two-component system chemotaxis sensor kinase CheA